MIKIFSCQYCEKEFERNWCKAHESPSQTNKFKYCGYPCAKKARVNRVKIYCRHCNKTIEVWPSKASTKKYCSKECYSKQKSIDNKGVVVNPGGTPWNKGTKGLVRAWNKGKPYYQIRGENNPNWKGGVTKKRNVEMGRIEYVQWRDAVFHRDNYTCQVCNVYGSTLHADHIERWADNEELRYVVSNGRTLCVPCHYYVTFKKKIPSGSTWGLGKKATARKRRLQ